MLAVEFNLPDQNRVYHKLSDYLGKWVVVYFYPAEACNFRDQKIPGSVVLGISKDSIESHIKFSDKYKLDFPILSDRDLTTIKAYEAWGVKKFMGKQFEGVIRKSYLIDLKGEVKKVYEKVNPLTHAGEITKDLEAYTTHW
jgi:peroxiredoxin Q/BCP